MGRISLREKFEACYMAVETDEGGKKKIRYVYYGPWYYWEATEQQIKKGKSGMLLQSLLSLAICALLLMRYQPQLECWYVLLPAAAALCFQILELSGVIQFLCAKNPTTKLNYDEVRRIMELAPVGREYSSVLTAAALVIRGISMGVWLDAVVTALGWLTGAYLANRINKQFFLLPVRMEENHVLEQIPEGCRSV